MNVFAFTVVLVVVVLFLYLLGQVITSGKGGGVAIVGALVGAVVGGGIGLAFAAYGLSNPTPPPRGGGWGGGLEAVAYLALVPIGLASGTFAGTFVGLIVAFKKNNS